MFNSIVALVAFIGLSVAQTSGYTRAELQTYLSSVYTLTKANAWDSLKDERKCLIFMILVFDSVFKV